MKTDQKILELVSDCKKALDNESFAYAKHVVFGMAPLLIESVEQLFGQRKGAYAQTDKMHSEALTLRNEVADLKAQLTVAERISNDRNEARVAGLSEITQLRNDLANARIASKQNLDAYDALHKRHQVTVSDFNAACDERDSLRLKLDTQTKIAVACQDAVDRAMYELLTALWGTEVKSDVESYPGDRLVTLLRVRLAPLLAARNAIKVELPSIEEMHEQFDKGFEEAYGEASMTCHGADQNGLRLARDLIAARLGLTKQKPTNTETVAPVDKAQLDSAIGELLGRSKKLTLLSRFYAESGRTELSHNGSTVTLSDLRSLIGVLDR